MLACIPFAMAASNEPTAAALGFLEKIRSGTIDLAPGKDTALSTTTIEEKRTEISRRLKRMANDLGKGRLEAGEVKLDQNLAAVLIRNTGGFDPSRMRVFAVGLVKIGDQWVPAPLPASFENTGVGFIAGVRQRVHSLENWMLRRQVTDLEQLREQSVTKMRQTIAASLDPEILRSGSPREVAEHFIAACARRDLPAVLGFLGGLQDTLPENWPDRLRATDQALANDRPAEWPWRLLIVPEVIRVPVEEETHFDGAPVSFGCIDPAGRSGKAMVTKLEIVHLQVSQDENGLSRIDPPARFFYSDTEEEDEEADHEYRENFPSQLRDQIPASPAPTMAEAAERLKRAFQADRLQPLISLMDLSGEPFETIEGCTRAAQCWGQIHYPASPRHPLMLGFQETDDRAIVSFQFASPREPHRWDLRSFHFEKSDAGWLILPGLTPSDTSTDSEIELSEWVDEQTKTWRKNWQSRLLPADCLLASIPAGDAPSADAAKQLVEAWLAATRKKDTAAALALAAVTDEPASATRLLRNLGYELGSPDEATIAHVDRGDTWTLVTVKIRDSFPIYLSVNTPAGPRLLIETDLFASNSGGRELLNKSALSRLKDFVDPAVFEELDQLFQQRLSAIGK